MARKLRNSRLDTRSARNKLPPFQEPYWSKIALGIYLGYRTGKHGGSWVARINSGNGRYKKRRIATADDLVDSNGGEILSFNEAVNKCLELARPANQTVISGYTVEKSVEDYLPTIESESGQTRARQSAKKHIYPELGHLRVEMLDTKTIQDWLNGLGALIPGDKEATRKRRATANRIFSILRAALNKAENMGIVESDRAWRRVQTFRKVDAPKIRYLTLEQIPLFINAVSEEFRPCVLAALYTGARWGEIRDLKVRDYNSDTQKVTLSGEKTGKQRTVALNEDGDRFFKQQTRGRHGSEFMLLRSDGEPWQRADQIRPVKAACKEAEIDPPISFHILRHTYASQLAMAGVSLHVISNLLGHADVRITEKNYAHLSTTHVDSAVRNSLPSF